MSHTLGKPSRQGRPDPKPEGKIKRGRHRRAKRGEPRPSRESDQLIVLGERESRSQGEAVDGDTQLAQETPSGHAGLEIWVPTSLRAIAQMMPSVIMRKRVSLKSPVLEYGTPGSVRGQPGNWLSYRDDFRAFLKGNSPFR